MTLPLYTNIYREAQNRPEYYSVSPDSAIEKLQDYPYLPGTYLISQGEGFCECLFTFVHLDRKIYQLVAKLIYVNSSFCWDFNRENYPSINQIILRSKLFGFCFLLYPYSPLFKIEGFIPILLVHEIVFEMEKEREDGSYFVTLNMEEKPMMLKICRYSKERNECDVYDFQANESTLKIPTHVKRKIGLKRPLCLKY